MQSVRGTGGPVYFKAFTAQDSGRFRYAEMPDEQFLEALAQYKGRYFTESALCGAVRDRLNATSSPKLVQRIKEILEAMPDRIYHHNSGGLPSALAQALIRTREQNQRTLFA